MPSVQLSALDIALVVIYLIAVTAIGLWASRGIRTSGDYFLAGKSLPWWVAGMSLVVSDIGAKDMVGLAGDAYRYGVVMMNFDFVACTFPVLIAAFLFMPLFWGSGVSTIPEFLGRRYNVAVRTFFAVIWSLFMIGTVATIFVSAASMFEGLLGWSFWFSVGLTAVFVGIFTTSGGLKAVAFTDVLSCIVLIAGAGLLCFIGLREVGGVGMLIEKVSAQPWAREHFELLPSASHPDVSMAGARARPRAGARPGLLGRQPGHRAAVVRREERSRRTRVLRVRRGHQACVPGAAGPARSPGDRAVRR